MRAIVVHGGAGGTSSLAQRWCKRAAIVGMKILRDGGSALDAVLAVVRFLENSSIFNAGSGAILRINGTTIECDAHVAISDGRQGSVGAVRDVKNPVLLAQAVMASPHRMLVGEGATQFARQIGLEPHPGPTQRVRQRYESLREAVAAGDLSAVAPGWTSEDLERLWGILGSPESSDTVGAIALDANGQIAVASSTGGMGLMALGRVGDVPVRGAGWEINPSGAVLATGMGEQIIQQQGSLKVSQLLEVGLQPQEACEQGVRLFPPRIPVGFIALTREAVGSAANIGMASYSITE